MSEPDLLLGRATDYDLPYSPSLLQALPRSAGRVELGIAAALPFTGWDLWNAYELSWLDAGGKPVIAWGEFKIPADSPALVESKSLKLYLNSLNQCRFASVAEVAARIADDLAGCVGVRPKVELHLPADWPTGHARPEGLCLDELALVTDRYHPAPELLRTGPATVERRLFSRLLRSRCPVTGQPDWGTVMVHYRGPAIDEPGLLAYIVSFRLHQDFHEACVERIFVDILHRCGPEWLTVGARYLRRGGLDINPWRTNAGAAPSNHRLFQQ